MNKLAELHLDAIEDSYHTVYVNMNEVEEVNNNLAASKSAEITEQIAIEFGNFLFSKGIEYYDDLANGVNYTVENKEGTFAMKGLFQEFLKTKQ